MQAVNELGKIFDKIKGRRKKNKMDRQHQRNYRAAYGSAIYKLLLEAH